MKTLKREEVYANTYRDLDHLRANLAAFIEQYYNRDRLHSALGTTPRKSSRTRLVRRPRRAEPPCGFSGLERVLERQHQPGIRLKQQRRDEKQHSINHQVC
jgi:transposase InsO family protein